LLQAYVCPAAAVNVTEPPLQNDNGPLAVTDVSGSAKTEVVYVAVVSIQPFVVVTNAE
jgi:hypothetical protein